MCLCFQPSFVVQVGAFTFKSYNEYNGIFCFFNDTAVLLTSFLQKELVKRAPMFADVQLAFCCLQIQGTLLLGFLV